MPPLFDTAARPPSYVLPKLLLAGLPLLFPLDQQRPRYGRGTGLSIIAAAGEPRAGSYRYSAAGRSDEIRLRCLERPAQFLIRSVLWPVINNDRGIAAIGVTSGRIREVVEHSPVAAPARREQ